MAEREGELEFPERQTGTPFCNLQVTMLDRMGVDVEQFSDSSGQITDL